MLPRPLIKATYPADVDEGAIGPLEEQLSETGDYEGVRDLIRSSYFSLEPWPLVRQAGLSSRGRWLNQCSMVSFSISLSRLDWVMSAASFEERYTDSVLCTCGKEVERRREEVEAKSNIDEALNSRASAALADCLHVLFSQQLHVLPMVQHIVLYLT